MLGKKNDRVCRGRRRAKRMFSTRKEWPIILNDVETLIKIVHISHLEEAKINM